jgi:hypothetical protein
LHMGLQLVGGSPQQLEAKLIQQVPGGMAAINAASEAKNAFSSLQKDGFAPTVKKYYEGADLQSTIVSGVKQYVIGTVVKQGLTMLASLFIPGAGIIQAAIKLYETIKFIWDKMKDIAATVNAITSSFADIAAGNVGTAAGKVTTSLVGMLGLAVGFLARVARVDGIGAWVRKKLEPIKTAISNAWNKFVTWFKGLVKPGTKTKSTDTKSPNAPKTLGQMVEGRIGEIAQFFKGEIAYKVWVEERSDRVRFVMNPNPVEATVKLADYRTKAQAQNLDANVFKHITDAEGIVANGKADLVSRLKKKGDDVAKANLLELASRYADRLATLYKKIDAAIAENHIDNKVRVFQLVRPQIKGLGNKILEVQSVSEASRKFTAREVTIVHVPDSEYVDVEPKQGGIVQEFAVADYKKTWVKYEAATGYFTKAELEKLNKKDAWGTYNEARRVLNYRLWGKQNNQDGMNWHHIHENAAGGEHSVKNLALTTWELNSTFNTWYRNPQRRVDEFNNELETTQGKSLRAYLASVGDNATHEVWGLYCIETHGYKVETTSNERGKYQKLVKQ